MSADPEQQRLKELLALESSGEANEAQREELALYRDTHGEAELQARAVEDHDPRPGEEHWLARVAGDELAKQNEASLRVRSERAGAGALLLVGIGFGLAAQPVLAGGALVAAFVLLLWSTIGLRLRDLGKDAYRDIEQ